MLDRIVLHGEFSLFTVRGNFWYQIYQNRRKKVLCSRLSLITLTTSLARATSYLLPRTTFREKVARATLKKFRRVTSVKRGGCKKHYKMRGAAQ